jgi:hypothetical protein
MRSMRFWSRQLKDAKIGLYREPKLIVWAQIGRSANELENQNRITMRPRVGAPRFELGTSSPPD